MDNQRLTRRRMSETKLPTEEQSELVSRPFVASSQQIASDSQASTAPTSNAGHDVSETPARTSEPARIQGKLMVGPAGDHYEHEADRVAAQVMGMPTPDSAPSGAPASVNVQRAGGGAGFEAGPDVERVLITQKGGGTPMTAAMRAFMEPRFGADFSGVRLHTNAQADHMNHALSARAFTHGQDIFFRQGEYQPGSTAGQRLLAHELTHVVQQTGVGSRVQRDFVKDAASDAALFDMESGSDDQPDLSEHTPEKKGKLAITKVNMKHFLERHTYKHQQLSAPYRRYDATLWPVGTTVAEVLAGLKAVLKLMEARTNKNKMVNKIYTVTMGGKSCNVQVGMITGGVLEQFFPVSGAGTQNYTTAELAQIYAEKQKPVAKPVVAETTNS